MHYTFYQKVLLSDLETDEYCQNPSQLTDSAAVIFFIRKESVFYMQI